MNPKARPERHTQNRVVALFTRPEAEGGLGYRHLGDWHHRENNRPVESELLWGNLRKRGHFEICIAAMLKRTMMRELRTVRIRRALPEVTYA